MVNPSAARHLTLVVGVLLCFFVYMGYVVKNRRTEAADDAGTTILATGGGQPESKGDASGLPLMTMGDGAEKTPSERLTPIGIPSLPAPIGADLPDPGEGPSSSSGELNLAEGLFAMGDAGSLRPPPAGSIEETAIPPAGAISGLVPDTVPLDGTASPFPSGGDSAPGGVSLPPPPGSQSIAETFAPVEQPPVAALRPEPERQPARPAIPEPGPEPRSVPIPSEPEPPLRLRPAGQEPPAPQSPPAQPRVQPPAPGTPPAPAFGGGGSDALRIYVIRPGDTLSRIAARELGSMALADNIYLLNRDVIANPDHLLVGTRIKLPPRETVEAAAAASAVAPPLAPTATRQPGVRPVAAFGPDGQAEGRVYRIAPGDTLSSIALRFYGSSAGWRFLHESNRAAIPDPNRLTVGTEISIPAYESQ